MGTGSVPRRGSGGPRRREQAALAADGADEGGTVRLHFELAPQARDAHVDRPLRLVSAVGRAEREDLLPRHDSPLPLREEAKKRRLGGCEGDLAARVVVNVVADPGGRAAAGPEALPAPAFFGADPGPPTSGAFVRRDCRVVASVGISGTPWRLVTMAAERDLARDALARIADHLLLPAGLALTFLALAAILVRQFLDPALALAAYGAASDGPPGPPPAVPEPWWGLRDRLAGAVRDRETTLHQLRAMIDGIPLRAVYVDHALVYRDANREFLQFTGLEIDALRVGRSRRCSGRPSVTSTSPSRR